MGVLRLLALGAGAGGQAASCWAVDGWRRLWPSQLGRVDCVLTGAGSG